MVALAAFGVDPGVVVAGPEIVEPGIWVRQQMPHDDQDGAAGRHDGALGTAAPGDPPVSFAEEGAGLGGSSGGVTQDRGQVGVA